MVFRSGDLKIRGLRHLYPLLGATLLSKIHDCEGVYIFGWMHFGAVKASGMRVCVCVLR
jgi:hypothetical protein